MDKATLEKLLDQAKAIEELDKEYNSKIEAISKAEEDLAKVRDQIALQEKKLAEMSQRNQSATQEGVSGERLMNEKTLVKLLDQQKVINGKLQTRLMQVDKRIDELAIYNRALNTRDSKLEEREAAVGPRLAMVDARELDLTRRENEMAAREKEIAERERRLGLDSSSVKSLQEVLARKLASNEAMQDKLDQDRVELRELLIETKSLERRLQRKTKELGEEIESNKREAVKLDTLIAEYETKLHSFTVRDEALGNRKKFLDRKELRLRETLKKRVPGTTLEEL